MASAPFEQGPIRPPSEARSLLIRATRGCPWNRCAFCPVYKGQRFAIRPVEEVLRDIDAAARALDSLPHLEGGLLRSPRRARAMRLAADPELDPAALSAAAQWSRHGRRTVFLQDADSLIRPHRDLLSILSRLRSRFPWTERITTYARSRTLARKPPEELVELAAAGLTRVHVGLESGSEEVLARMAKGATREEHIRGGRKAREAGLELSEYVMPGLGGIELSEEHARETASALVSIEPDMIRLRTLAVVPGSPLGEEVRAGRFTRLEGEGIVREIRLLLEGLQGLRSRLRSDHVLNLLGELEGNLPEDRDAMLAVIDAFLELPPEERLLYRVGRRLGVLGGIHDMEDPVRRRRAERTVAELGITAGNVEAVLEELMVRFL